MPRVDHLTELGRDFVNQLPVVLREDPDYLSLMHCSAREVERIESAIEWARAQANPLTADAWGLEQWARLLKLPLTQGELLAVQREKVVARFRALIADPSEAAWVARVSELLGAGTHWTYERFVPEFRRWVNLVPNPRGVAGVTIAQGWGAANATLTQIPGGGVRYTTTTSAVAGASYSQVGAILPAKDIFVTPGETYSVSVEISAMPSGRTVRPGMFFRNGAGMAIPSGSVVLPDLTGPGVTSATGVAPAGAATLGIQMYRQAGGAAAVGDVVDIAGWSAAVGRAAPPVKDGSFANWEWVGTPNASQSREVEAVAPQHIRVFLPGGVGTQLLATQRAILRAETPAEIVLLWGSTTGFILDQSQMDIDEMSI